MCSVVAVHRIFCALPLQRSGVQSRLSPPHTPSTKESLLPDAPTPTRPETSSSREDAATIIGDSGDGFSNHDSGWEKAETLAAVGTLRLILKMTYRLTSFFRLTPT